jgi:hypothetical protein
VVVVVVVYNISRTNKELWSLSVRRAFGRIEVKCTNMPRNCGPLAQTDHYVPLTIMKTFLFIF